MKEIEVEYTIEIEDVIEYWQKKLEELWSKRQKMDKEIEMIDNTITFLNSLNKAMNYQIQIVALDETKQAN